MKITPNVLKEDPQRTQNWLSALGTRFVLETSIYERFWAPEVQTLAEVFGVAEDHDAGNISAARAHFLANPKALEVVVIDQKTRNGRLNHSVVRVVSETFKTTTCELDRVGETLQQWFLRTAVADVVAQLDLRLKNLIVSMASRVNTVRPRDPDPKMWVKEARGMDTYLVLMDHAARAAMKLPEDPTIVDFTGPLLLLPSAAPLRNGICLLRNRYLGSHVFINDSGLATMTREGTAITATFEVWDGCGFDTGAGFSGLTIIDIPVPEEIV